MRTINLIIATISSIAILLFAGQTWAALNLEGQSGIFLNSLAYTIAPGITETSSHYVNLDALGAISTYNISVGIKNGVELGATRISSAVTGVNDQNSILGKWNFAKETKASPALAVSMIYRDLIGGNSSTDVGLSATKILLVGKKPLVVNLGIRSTKAKWQGLLGFGNDRETKLEGSFAYFVTSKFAVGAEFKQQPDGLRTWHDVAFRYVVSNNLNIDVGIANLGSAIDNQVALAVTRSW